MKTFPLLYVVVFLFSLDISFASDKPVENQHKPVESSNVTKLEQTAKETNHKSSLSEITEIPFTTSEIPVIPIPPIKLPIWTVEDKHTLVPCILLKSNITIEVPHNKSNSSTSEISQINVPFSANATGSCGTNSTEQYILLKWTVDFANKTKENHLNFTFEKKNDKFFLSHILADIFLPNVSEKESHTELAAFNLTELVTPLNMSYLCSKGNSLQLKSSPKNETFTVHFKQLQLEAFNTKKRNGTDAFNEAHNCEPFITADIVPIIVGCTLALLVIIVLVAYLISRKRSQARGYLSM